MCEMLSYADARLKRTMRHFPILADVSKQLDETPFVTTASEIPSAVFALVKDQILLVSTELLEVMMFADSRSVTL